MPSLGAHQLSFEEQKQRAADIVRLLSMYINILDSYVIEFFSENLWEKVPRSWRPTLSALTAPQLASLLLENRSSAGQESVWPLSLLAFRAAAHGLALPRQPRGVSPPREAIPGSSREPEEFQANKSQSSRLGHLFRKHVRPKKQHEIRRLAGLVKKLCNATGCEHVVDMGSGQGHLSRYLAFHHGLQLTGLEASEELVTAARRFDRELLLGLEKETRRETEGVRELSLHSLDPPRHLVHQVLSEEEGKLLEELGQGQGSPPLVLAALHACGDLGPAALRLFAQCPGARGLALVSCCYMKASEEGGYPMSAWVRSLPAHQLPYKLRETACHAVEDFAQRLRGQSPALRSHCYRAALEVIIRHLHPHLRRPPLHAGGKAHLLPFPDYAREGLRKLGLHSGMSWDVAQVEALLEQGNKVLAYFCLTLSLAPVIETLILLDRVIYLQEQGFHCQLLPLFEPRFSPRNFVLLAAKLSGQLSQLLCPADGASCPK
ncbi:methyltransferase-like protein 25B isoform X1 [Mobula birostris]|uniref:methyltransferase-like protein 25B isoform X1 n=1 Tax=Mobula birostris TaxID=1983395 RepID=UPI003B285DA4